MPTTAPPLEQETGFQVRALLDEKQLQQLWRWLPAREHTKDARIVYCTGTHGRSLQTLYRKARNEWGHRQGNSAVLPAPESLLIIKTTLKDVVAVPCSLTAEASPGSISSMGESGISAPSVSCGMPGASPSNDRIGNRGGFRC